MNKEKIRVKLPDNNIQDSVYEAEKYLSQVCIEGDNIILPNAADDSLLIQKINRSPDYYRDRTSQIIVSQGKEKINVDKAVSTVKITIEKPEFSLSREIEFASHLCEKKNDEKFLKDPDVYDRNLLQMPGNQSYGFVLLLRL